MLIALMIYLSTLDPERAAQFISLESDACHAIVSHMPDADVAYKGGVDVHGKPVIEADLNATPVKPPETATFPITVDMAKYAGITVPAGIEGHAAIGTITVGRDGRMTFDGKPMEGEAESALRALCAQKEPLQKPTKVIYNN